MPHVPELPDEASIKPVLNAIPTPPWQTIIVSNKPDRNGNVYTKACLDKAMVEFQKRVDKRLVFVHEYHRERRPDLTTVIGFVDEAAFDGERLDVQVKFINSTYKLLQHHVGISYGLDATGIVGDDLQIHALYAYPTPMADLM